MKRLMNAANIIYSAVLSFILISGAMADTIYLKQGGRQEGDIIEETPEYIVVRDSDTNWEIVYYRRFIDRIERGPLPSKKKAEKAKKEKAGKKKAKEAVVGESSSETEKVDKKKTKAEDG